jgi:hypothetical protein
MLATLLAMTLAHHDPSPYGWHMSCERFQQLKIETTLRDDIDLRSKWNLIQYFKTKVEGQCDGLYT